MTESILVVLELALAAGGGIIVIDALVIRKIRQLARDSRQSPPPDEVSGAWPAAEDHR